MPHKDPDVSFSKSCLEYLSCWFFNAWSKNSSSCKPGKNRIKINRPSNRSTGFTSMHISDAIWGPFYMFLFP